MEYYFSGIVIVAVLEIPLTVSPILGVSHIPLEKGGGDTPFVVKIARGITSKLFVGMPCTRLSDIPTKA